MYKSGRPDHDKKKRPYNRIFTWSVCGIRSVEYTKDSGSTTKSAIRGRWTTGFVQGFIGLHQRLFRCDKKIFDLEGYVLLPDGTIGKKPSSLTSNDGYDIDFKPPNFNPGHESCNESIRKLQEQNAKLQKLLTEALAALKKCQDSK